MTRKQQLSAQRAALLAYMKREGLKRPDAIHRLKFSKSAFSRWLNAERLMDFETAVEMEIRSGGALTAGALRPSLIRAGGTD